VTAEQERAIDPLEMAENTMRAVLAAADAQTANPLESYVQRVGERAFQSAQLGACCALVSIAADIRAISDVFERQSVLAVDQLARIASALERGGLS
jgi:hypothetical protein